VRTWKPFRVRSAVEGLCQSYHSVLASVVVPELITNYIILAINQSSWQMNQLVFVSNKTTPHKIHDTHHTHPSFIFRLKYPRVVPCLKNKNTLLLTWHRSEVFHLHWQLFHVRQTVKEGSRPELHLGIDRKSRLTLERGESTHRK
jgi:hypothetical protein